MLNYTAHFTRDMVTKVVAVKGSRQYKMVVVPYRPFYKAMVLVAILLALGTLILFIYQHGENRGLALRAEVALEHERVIRELAASQKLIRELRQELANMEVGGEIDGKANQEIRRTLASLQDKVAQRDEEINFYKGVMLPNVAGEGLRIERLNMTMNGRGRVRYSLLLTQVVDKHDYVRGDLAILLLGRATGREKTFPLSELKGGQSDDLKFRFKYFQDMSGEFELPDGFEPLEVRVVARPFGSGEPGPEKTFPWLLDDDNGG